MTTQNTQQTMLKRSFGVAFGGAAAAATGLTLMDGVAQRTTGAGVPVAGVITDIETAYSGVPSGLTATLDRAAGVTNIDGIVSSTAVELAKGVTSTTFTSELLPENLSAEPGVCDMLFLILGPQFLDVRGLTIDLQPIVLDIDAVPESGNLLCTVTGLLDHPGQGVLNGPTNPDIPGLLAAGIISSATNERGSPEVAPYFVFFNRQRFCHQAACGIRVPTPVPASTRPLTVSTN